MASLDAAREALATAKSDAVACDASLPQRVDSAGWRAQGNAYLAAT